MIPGFFFRIGPCTVRIFVTLQFLKHVSFVIYIWKHVSFVIYIYISFCQRGNCLLASLAFWLIRHKLCLCFLFFFHCIVFSNYGNKEWYDMIWWYMIERMIWNYTLEVCYLYYLISRVISPVALIISRLVNSRSKEYLEGNIKWQIPKFPRYTYHESIHAYQGIGPLFALISRRDFSYWCNWLTAHNWQKWKKKKSIFLTYPCQKIYRVEAVGLSISNNTLKKYNFCEHVKFRAIWWKIDILWITA